MNRFYQRSSSSSNNSSSNNNSSSSSSNNNNNNNNSLVRDEELLDICPGDESSNHLVDFSMDSSLPSAFAQEQKYQVYPCPPSGVKSLIGGFVTLDGQSVELPPSPSERQQQTDYDDDDDDEEGQ